MTLRNAVSVDNVCLTPRHTCDMCSKVGCREITESCFQKVHTHTHTHGRSLLLAQVFSTHTKIQNIYCSMILYIACGCVTLRSLYVCVYTQYIYIEAPKKKEMGTCTKKLPALSLPLLSHHQFKSLVGSIYTVCNTIYFNSSCPKTAVAANFGTTP